MKTIHQPPVSRRAMNLAYWATQNARRLPGAHRAGLGRTVMDLGRT